jgi:hypothetical protein
MRIAYIALTFVYFCLIISLAFRFDELTAKQDTKLPAHIQSFCQAQYEIYGVEFDSCINAYKNRRK